MDEWISRLHTLLCQKKGGELLVLPHDTQALCGTAAADNNPGHGVTIPFLGPHGITSSDNMSLLSYTLYGAFLWIIALYIQRHMHSNYTPPNMNYNDTMSMQFFTPMII